MAQPSIRYFVTVSFPDRHAWDGVQFRKIEDKVTFEANIPCGAKAGGRIGIARVFDAFPYPSLFKLRALTLMIRGTLK